jgi:hypothetical protein
MELPAAADCAAPHVKIDPIVNLGYGIAGTILPPSSFRKVEWNHGI